MGLYSILWPFFAVATAWSSPQLRLLNRNHALCSVVHRLSHIVFGPHRYLHLSCQKVTDSLNNMCYLCSSFDYVAWALKLDNTHCTSPQYNNLLDRPLRLQTQMMTYRIGTNESYRSPTSPTPRGNLLTHRRRITNHRRE